MLGLWFLFYGGFRFLDVMGGVGLMIINRLFALFFLGLGMLLVLSSSITAYTTLFQSREMPYLLLRPLHFQPGQKKSQVPEIKLTQESQQSFSLKNFFFSS